MKPYYFVQSLFNTYLVKDNKGNVIVQKPTYGIAKGIADNLNNA